MDRSRRGRRAATERRIPDDPVQLCLGDHAVVPTGYMFTPAPGLIFSARRCPHGRASTIAAIRTSADQRTWVRKTEFYCPKHRLAGNPSKTVTTGHTQLSLLGIVRGDDSRLVGTVALTAVASKSNTEEYSSL